MQKKNKDKVNLTKEILNNIQIYNSHGIAEKAGNKLFISFTSAETGRASRPAKWSVYGMGFVTDPHAHFLDMGNKTFTVGRRDEKEPMRLEAVKWVKEKYNIDLTDRDAWGHYHPAGTLDKLSKLLGK